MLPEFAWRRIARSACPSAAGDFTAAKKQPIDAIPYLELAAKVAPDSAIILNNLAIAYTRCQRSDEAVAVYLRSVAVDPNNVETRKNLAEVYMEQQEFLLAVDVLAKAIELNPRRHLFG